MDCIKRCKERWVYRGEIGDFGMFLHHEVPFEMLTETIGVRMKYILDFKDPGEHRLRFENMVPFPMEILPPRIRMLCDKFSYHYREMERLKGGLISFTERRSRHVSGDAYFQHDAMMSRAPLASQIVLYDLAREKCLTEMYVWSRMMRKCLQREHKSLCDSAWQGNGDDILRGLE